MLYLLSLFLVAFNVLMRNPYPKNEQLQFRDAEELILSAKCLHFDVNLSPKLMVLAGLFNQNASRVSKYPRRKQTWWSVNKFVRTMTLLLLLSGDVASNPGPRQPRHPCGTCSYAVGTRQRAIQCDECDFWTHLTCIPHMTNAQYYELGNSDEPWFCNACTTRRMQESIDGMFWFSDSFFSNSSDDQDCGLPDFSDSFFNTTISEASNLSLSDISSDEGDVTDDILLTKLKGLREKHRLNTNIAYLNINSLRYKASDVISILNTKYIDVLCVAETKLDNTFPNEQFQATDFTTYRKDGPSALSGGLLVYVSSRVSSRRRIDLEPSCECIVVELVCERKKAFLYFCYRSPRINVNTYLELLSRSVDQALIETDNISIIGDLNQNLMMSTHSNELRDFADLYNMTNIIKSPTCYKSVNNNSLVDIVFTTDKSFYKASDVLKNGLSDCHHMILCVMKSINIKRRSKFITYRSYKTFDQELFENDLAEAPFHVGAVFDSTDDKFWYFQNLYSRIINEHAPLKQKCIRPVQPPFINSLLRKNVNRKAQLRHRYNKFPTRRNWEQYRVQRNRTTAIRKQSIRNYLLEKCSGKADKQFYNTVRPLISTKPVTQHPTQLLEDGKLIHSEAVIANKMNTFFTNIADDIGRQLSENNDNINELCDDAYVEKCIKLHENHPSIVTIKEKFSSSATCHFTEVSVSEVEKLFKNIDVRKATGYDLIPPKILKYSMKQIVYPITYLVNDMFKNGDFPDMLKLAEIGPLHKKDSLLEKSNFRPLSILTSLSKLFEKCIDTQLQKFGSEIFCGSLSAYRKNFSTQHVLLQVTESIKEGLDKKMSAGSVLMDLSKAFDCLQHDLIIAKLEAYNFNTSALKLLSNYLRQRKQRVKIANTRSDWLSIKKGVPQGSIVGPTLFNYFINDLIMLESNFTFANYADDNTIYVSAPNRSILLDKLTSATCSALRWFEDNGLQANPSKFQFIIFGNEDSNASLFLGDNCIHACTSVNLLGVTLDQKLNFKEHVRNLCRKAAWQLTALSRISKYLNQEAKMKIFKSYIVSNFEYCKLIWHFCGKTDSKKVEKLQERGLRIVFNDFDATYESLLTRANFKSLEENRLRTMLVEVYKAYYDMSPDYINKLFTIKSTTYDLVRKQQLVLKRTRTKAYGQQTLTYQGSRLWNKLPNSLKAVNNINDFKTQLLNHNLIALRK